MIVTWMLAALLFALLLGIAARLMESAARLVARQGRAPWAAALSASLVWPLVLPLLSREKIVQLAPVVIGSGAVRSVVAQLPSMSTAASTRANEIVIALWGLVSLILLARLLFAQRALNRLSRAAVRTSIDGHEVFVMDNVGPAVVGITSPRVAVPAWLTELDEPLRKLVLRHEREHCSSRDTLLLWLGEIAVALMPWNPAIWWQARQLRLAIELDCDARTLRDSGAEHMYGKLLLLIAERQRMTRLAPMLAESNSHLAQRITAMTRRSVSHRPLRIAALTIASVVAIAAACSERVTSDLTSPTPMAGRLVSPSNGAPALMANGTVYREYQIERAAKILQGGTFPRYPAILKEAGVEGEVIASFVVDTAGLVDASTIRIIKSSHQLFTNAVVASIPTMHYSPALVGGRPVRQLVTAPYEFQVYDSTKVQTKNPPVGTVLITALPGPPRP